MIILEAKALTIIDCPHCGVQNKVDPEKLRNALCGSCNAKLLDESVPEDFTGEDIAASLEAKPDSIGDGDVDVSKWIVKIGDEERQTQYVEAGFWKKMKKYASKVPFAREAVSMYYCATDPATPIKVKATAIGALAYWILPIDVIADFVPVIGFADDATAILIAYRAISSHITDEHREKAEQFFAS
jgi:uncharacterized membrane protein YkvA (DUF1232 family)